jgi:hypothetical protein
LITATQSQTTDVLNGIPEGATYEEILQVLDDRFGKEHFAAAYRSQLKARA